jgi:hypothetical protein
MITSHSQPLLGGATSWSTPDDVRQVQNFLTGQGTFDFRQLPTGLFSAAALSTDAAYTGYENVWVRDNIHIAHYHFLAGKTKEASECINGLRTFFIKHKHRFRTLVDHAADARDPMQRPHIRFNGTTLEENAEKWSHTQNDALGYFLWLYCKMVRSGSFAMQAADVELISLFVKFFQTVQYWQEEDSGHWEESKKVQASSIGVVVAALQELRLLVQNHNSLNGYSTHHLFDKTMLQELIDYGSNTLQKTLPYECIQRDPGKYRKYDAALLFLIYPLQVVDYNTANQIIQNVEAHLLGEHGIRRYLLDSFWCADYKELCRPEVRTADVSDDMTERDSLVKPGQEAQWCIFDPILSTIYGRRYVADRQKTNLEKSQFYLNRSLSQLTGPDGPFPQYRCPELYYLENSQYVPNDVTPLLWTQANLGIAFNQMAISLAEGLAY